MHSILRQFQVISVISLTSTTGNYLVWRELILFYEQKIICRESGKNLIKSCDLFQYWVIYSYNKQLCNLKPSNFIINHVTLEIFLQLYLFILQVQKMPGVFYSLPYIIDQISPQCEGAVSFGIIKYVFTEFQNKIPLLLSEFQLSLHMH